MLSYDEMPEDNEDLAKVEVSFPTLPRDSAESCPVSISEIMEYLASEGENVVPDDLHFIRTAQVAEREFWIWRFVDSDGDECYVTVDHGSNEWCIGYDANWHGLSPEQFMLGIYHNVL
ncbi:MAG: hypothetical protein EPO21_18980 [Chloroflexota bacterium]|nr:MAG: hypothetical protein EPO21_18980 [Chloroflexota bacterium]